MIETYVIDPRIAKKADTVAELFVVAPQIVRVTDFDDEELVEKFAEAVSRVTQSSQEILPIVIDSYGGDVYSLWALVDILSSVRIPIATIIEGKAMSCGAALFTCGTDGMRYIGPHATIMIHDVTATTHREGKSEDVKADAKETERLNRALYDLMEKNTRRRKNTFWKIVQDRGRADWYITPTEAVKLNIANHIGIPILKTTITVETSLELP